MNYQYYSTLNKNNFMIFFLSHLDFDFFQPQTDSQTHSKCQKEKEASRAECIKQLWAYIKKNNLQDPENKQFFTPDKKMSKVIEKFNMRFRLRKVYFT